MTVVGSNLSEIVDTQKSNIDILNKQVQYLAISCAMMNKELVKDSGNEKSNPEYWLNQSEVFANFQHVLELKIL